MKKILLIEDNKGMRENISEILELAHYTVITAENGKEGIEKALIVKPDLIVCDIMMPVLDGYGVLHLLSKNPETNGIPFIFLSAKAERSELRKGMEMGADDYVTKPFDDIELLNAVESRLKKSERIQRIFSRTIDGFNEFVNDAKGFESLSELTINRDVRVCRKKESIYVHDTYAKGIYMLVKGKVKTVMMNNQGKELITGLYKEGDFFGYLALLEDKPYVDSAIALEDAEICLIPKEEFFSLLYKNEQVSRRFIKLLSDNLLEKEEQLLQLAYNSVRKRVAQALITLANRYSKNGQQVFTMTISREDLANLAGTATETTIRTISDFKEEKLIDVKGGSITILNYQGLKDMKN